MDTAIFNSMIFSHAFFPRSLTWLSDSPLSFFYIFLSFPISSKYFRFIYFITSFLTLCQLSSYVSVSLQIPVFFFSFTFSSLDSRFLLQLSVFLTVHFLLQIPALFFTSFSSVVSHCLLLPLFFHSFLIPPIIYRINPSEPQFRFWYAFNEWRWKMNARFLKFADGW